jgi:uncharacterized protein (DUF1697 family)
MVTHIALIRGVNVGGNMLRMEHLKQMLATLGFADVRTYLQSGNALFRARGTSAKLAATIERALVEVTRLPVSVVVRTPAELQRAIAANPFPREASAAPRTVHVTFLAAAPSEAGIAALGRIEAGVDRWQATGAQIYLHCPHGYGRSKLSNTAIERALGVRATTRNWSTVMALHEMTVA